LPLLVLDRAMSTVGIHIRVESNVTKNEITMIYNPYLGPRPLRVTVHSFVVPLLRRGSC
jgi:hypothetical protein